MQRVAIIGTGGAGKSTLARRMGERLGIEVIHLDHLFWQPGWEPTPIATASSTAQTSRCGMLTSCAHRLLRSPRRRPPFPSRALRR